MNAEYSRPVSNCITSWRQLLDSSGRLAVLSSRSEAKLLSDDSTPPGPEHHGLFAVALGAQQCHDNQPRPRHKEQPLYSGSAGKRGVQAQKTCRWFDTQIAALCVAKLFFSSTSTALILRLSCTVQLGVAHSYLMMSYQYKFQDEEQTKVKGSVKYVFLPFYISM